MISWITIVWSMTASACLTLAFVHGMVWWRRREARVHLLFALMAFAATLLGAGELWMMRSGTPEQFATAVRWTHVPGWLLVLTIVGFVNLYLKAGRPWLAWTVCGVRTVSLILNFSTGVNLNYQEVTALRRISFLGEPVSIGIGMPNPSMFFGQLSLVLLLIFVADAALAAWRRDHQWKAIGVGGSVAFCALLAVAQSIAVFWAHVPAPITTSLFFMFVIAAMNFELSRDVFRATQLARALRESEQDMTLAAGAARLGVWIRDLERNELSATDTWRELFGFTKTERLDLDRCQQQLHPEDREAVCLACAKAIEIGRYESEYRVILQDGRVRWIASRGGVEYNSGGRATLMRGVSLDITERKQSEESLRESEARFRAMANTAPLMIWMSDVDKLRTFSNQSWLDFTGRTREQELGDGWADSVHSQDINRCLETYGGSFDLRKPFEMEYRLRRKNGEYHWILEKGSPRFSADGSLLGYIGSCIDITDRKLAEESAQNLSGRLIHAQEETQAQLARELHDDLSQSLALLAIELDMFGHRPPAEQVDIAARMEEFSAHVKRLSSEVHQISHELHPAKLEQLGLAAAVRGFCKEFGTAHQLAIEFVERDVPRAMPNDTALCLYRVAQEALHNVVKHSGGSMAKIELTRSGEQLCLAVEDDGTGFDPETVRTNNGSLGLVSMNERARFVGGRLTIKSRPGAGTRVEACVPLAGVMKPAPAHL